MDISSLYTITLFEPDYTEKSASASILLNSDHPIFEGHFPGSPVLPGVCIVQIVKHLMEKVLSQGLKLCKAENIKFLLPVNPLEVPEPIVELKWAKLADSYLVSATIKHDDKKFVSFRGTFVYNN